MSYSYLPDFDPNTGAPRTRNERRQRQRERRRAQRKGTAPSPKSKLYLVGMVILIFVLYGALMALTAMIRIQVRK